MTDTFPTPLKKSFAAPHLPTFVFFNAKRSIVQDDIDNSLNLHKFHSYINGFIRER